MHGAVVCRVTCRFFLVEWGEPVLFPKGRPSAVVEDGACEESEREGKGVSASFE